MAKTFRTVLQYNGICSFSIVIIQLILPQERKAQGETFKRRKFKCSICHIYIGYDILTAYSFTIYWVGFLFHFLFCYTLPKRHR